MTLQSLAHLIVKHGLQTDPSEPIAFPSEFIVEQKGLEYLIKPLSPPIYVNGAELTVTRPLQDGDEIAIPPSVIYVFHRGPIPETETFASIPLVTVSRRPAWITAIAIFLCLAGLVGIALGLDQHNLYDRFSLNRGVVFFGHQRFGLVLIALGVVYVVTAVGLWQMRKLERIGDGLLFFGGVLVVYRFMTVWVWEPGFMKFSGYDLATLAMQNGEVSFLWLVPLTGLIILMLGGLNLARCLPWMSILPISSRTARNLSIAAILVGLSASSSLFLEIHALNAAANAVSGFNAVWLDQGYWLSVFGFLLSADGAALAFAPTSRIWTVESVFERSP
jgi:hypothetical protein